MVIRMISTDYSKSEEMAKDIFKTVDNILMQVKETQNEFIFSTLSKYTMDNFNIVVEKEELVQAIRLIKMCKEKEELVQAIQLIRMCKETGTDLRQYYNTATNGTELYRKGYDKGFEAGIQEARNRLERAFN